MAVQPGQVNKLTTHELMELDSWDFINSYRTYEDDLVALARGTFTTVCLVLGVVPTRKAFYRTYRKALRWTDLYNKKIIGRKSFLPPSLYKHFAHLLAKYVLEQHWNDISSAPCP